MSRVKAHTRRSKSGVPTWIKPHERKGYKSLQKQLKGKHPHQMTLDAFHKHHVGKKYKDFIGRETVVGRGGHAQTEAEKRTHGYQHAHILMRAVKAGEKIHARILKSNPNYKQFMSERKTGKK